MIKPGVQNPHWTAASSMKACWMSDISPFGPARPSRVRISPALGPHSQVNAGIEALAVDQDVAGSTLSYLTALLDAGKAEIISQDIG